LVEKSPVSGAVVGSMRAELTTGVIRAGCFTTVTTQRIDQRPRDSHTALVGLLEVIADLGDVLRRRRVAAAERTVRGSVRRSVRGSFSSERVLGAERTAWLIVRHEL
jgi:hypothetical protein